MLPPERVKHFVRNTLGCTCPEEVFLSIEIRRSVRLNSFITLDTVLIVGDRLLIYITEAGTEGCVEEHLPVLAAAGRKERDEKGLNRFRLVLVSDIPDEVRRAAERQFGELRNNDAKLHLHAIKKRDSPFTAEDAVEMQEGTKGRG